MAVAPAAPRHRQLRADLDAIAVRAARAIARRRARVACGRAAAGAFALLLLAPAIVLAEALGAFAAGVDPGIVPGPLLLAALTLAVPALSIAVAALAARLRPVDRCDALGAADAAFDLEDRLLTANEFLRATGPTDRTAFMAAAVDDAEPHARAATVAELALPAAAPTAPRRPLVFVALAAGLAALALWVGSWPRAVEQAPSGGELSARTGAVGTAPADRPAARERAQELAAEPRVARPEPKEPAAQAEAGKPTADLAEKVREATGRAAGGRSSEAASAHGQSDANASPSQQGRATREPERQPKDDSASRKPAEQRVPAEPPPKPQPNEESGSTTGKGASRGSNKNPATSDWSSRDRVETQKDEEVDNDDEVDDDEEEQESRGGVQPNLRDRKPPVNRDLRIGFGNRPNPDANGRGGPSELKKSRGVASLVLGVPIPDRIKGQPNRGRTKVTQERVEPQAEDSEPVAAEERVPRAGPIGYLTRHEPPPWMRDVIRRYFLSLRNSIPEDR